MSQFIVAKSVDDNSDVCLIGKMANRHGLIAGATGTGKTITLRKFAESFSNLGVPVFLSDVKGDLSGIVNKGSMTGKIAERMTQFGLDESYLSGFPVRFWDVYGEMGIPVRVTVSQMGAMLLARLMELNDTQEGLLTIVFKVADDNGWQVIDLKDLRSLLQYVLDNAEAFRTDYGNISSNTVGAISRKLLQLESQGADLFFGEPSLRLSDWLQTQDGKGVINILQSTKLVNNPRLYGAFLLWFLAQLYSELPEVGDLDRPKFVLFFDEAHLMFNDAPKALVTQVEQVVRLIRSKGVGVYFVTQNPLDLPETILGQLGNRVQHALRAFTPRDQKAVKTAAQTFRQNPKFDTQAVIMELGVGEALVSLLQADGTPSMVERSFIMPPSSALPPLDTASCQAMSDKEPMMSYYKVAVDNYSAYEALADKQAQTAQAQEQTVQTQTQNEKAQPQAQKDEPSVLDGFLGGLSGGRKKAGQGVAYNLADTLGNQINKQATQAIKRSLLGVIKNLLK